MDDARPSKKFARMKITFRTDASLTIGTGHVMRCMTLALALRERGAVCRFITRALPGHMADRIRAEGFGVTLLPAPNGQPSDGPPAHLPWAGVDWRQDASEARADMADDSPDWLVIDHYAFDSQWQRAARPEGTKLMVIDDLADRPHACDMLLDQNFGRIRSDYDSLVSEACVRLIGPQYALLRSEFADARARTLKTRTRRNLRHLLVTMGGVDPRDATSLVLQTLSKAILPKALRITVIMGSNAPALEQVRTLAKGMPRSTEVAVDVTDMAARMASADLAIGAAGSTTWERCALGLPTIIVQIADNQAGIAQALSVAGVALDPGPMQAPDFENNLLALLTKASDHTWLNAMSEKAAAICDGNGVMRIVKRMGG